MATIEKKNTKNGISYKITVSNGYDITGKQIRERTTYTPTPGMTSKQIEKELKQVTFEFEQKVKNGKLLKGEKLSFYEFTSKWLKEYAIHHLEKSTLSTYIDMLDRHIMPSLGHLKLTDIKPIHLNEFYNSLATGSINNKKGYAPSTIKKYHAVISSILSTACKWELIEYNPCNNVTPPSKEAVEKINYFTLEQAEIFLKTLDLQYTTDYKEHQRTASNGTIYNVKSYKETRGISEQLRLFFYMALFGGFRRGELIALKWSDIDFNKGIVHVIKAVGLAGSITYEKTTKNHTTRSVYLPNGVMEMLKTYKSNQNIQRLKLGEKWVGNDNIFIQWNGKQMDISTPTHTFKSIIKKYNLTADNEHKLPSITLHGLRHTNATLLIASNTDIRTVSSRLGHSNTSTTLNIYAHSLEQNNIEASNTLQDLFNKKQVKKVSTL